MASSESLSSSFDPPDLPSSRRRGHASASIESARAASTCSTDFAPTNPAVGNSAAWASLNEEDQRARPEEDEPVCRICLSGDGEGDDLGGLIIPCKCSGTARFVHRYCLTEWRTRDRQNGFYKCAMCGERYRLRKTRWTRVAAAKNSTAYLTLGLFFVFSIIAGFVADPVLRATERGHLGYDIQAWRKRFIRRPHKLFRTRLSRVILSSPTHLLHTSFSPTRSSTITLDPGSYVLPPLSTAGDALRESVSTVGYFLGDCRFSSAREYGWREVPILPGEPGSDEFKAYMVEKVGELSVCGRRWGYESDDERPGRAVRAVMHIFKGGMYLSLWFMLLNQLAFKIGLACQWLPPLRRLSPWPRGPTPAFWRALAAYMVACAMGCTVPMAKKARRGDRLFSVWQVVLVFATVPTVVGAYSTLYSSMLQFVKDRIAGVEDVVLDVRDEEGKNGGGLKVE
ncbi:hypothetical protein JCM8547_001472 [Rhodosporidiobolus lusitaniae]